jgi:outer membrane receptor for ferrienterochelin and colicin
MKQNNYQKLLLTTLISASIANTNLANADTEKENVQMSDIIVTAKSNSTVESIAATVDIIHAEDITQSGASNLQDVLEDVAGFSFTINSSSTYGRKNIGLRGMDSQHILILVDGERTSATDGFIGHSNFQSSAFDIKNIERIEIIKGAGSVLYGSEAMGGVINIITKANAKKTYTQLSLSKGFVNERDGGDSTGISIGAGGGFNDFYGSFSFNTDSRDLVQDSMGTVEFEETSNRNISGALSYQFSPDTKVDFNISDGKEERNLLAPYYDIERNKVSIGFSTDISGWDLFLKAYKTESDAGYHAFGASPYYTHEIEDRILSAEIQNAITDNQFVTFGFEQHKSDYFKNYSSPSKTDYKAEGTTQNSVYLQDKINIGDNVLTLGARLDNNSQFGNGTSASLGYVHHLSNALSLKANVGTAYKAPNIKEADSNYLFTHGYPGASVFVGNSDLEAETSRTAELALTGKSTNSDWSIAIYHTTIKDMIVSANTGLTAALTGGDLYTYENINKATVKGVEISYNMDLTDTISLDSSLTGMKTDDDNGNDLPFRPKTIAKVKLTKEFNHDFRLALSANHTGKSYDGDDSVDSYTLYDAVLNKEVNDHISLQLAVNNLTDEKLDNPSDNHMTELLGREVKLTLNASF